MHVPLIHPGSFYFTNSDGSFNSGDMSRLLGSTCEVELFFASLLRSKLNLQHQLQGNIHLRPTSKALAKTSTYNILMD
ncbi:hypothetical protein GOBAR_AA21109 [Gossypium barbadense]|uniref:Uncharacterized protein n=1 Tax=Gossypium barbadense TaxID=3634 RepID=A0A2P5X889_GOSBA|nr:hypothetical protein GOBAR_AA21109 [Gossypium barbadense]